MTMDKINKINDVLILMLKIAYLNLIWLGITILGLGIFSVGPASYALMKYYDQTLRLKNELPVLRTFWQYFKERYRQSVLISWIYLAVCAVFIVNIFFNRVWSLQIINVLMLILVLFSFTHVYTLMAATKYEKISELLKGAALLGFGYLHYSIITWTILGVSYFLAARFAPALLFLFGFSFAGFLFAMAGRKILKEFLPIENENKPREI
ncbi:YesL family protein [Enterococcus timonensis]|uniref:YesL family protein n=1 Tax=Enterococcus timonensis TaxID=1852364 RepID=UPI0008D8FAB2|nr:DUF624 domain-containing protein [Enterococcus timonensis]